jgi:hypothetical protein
VDSDLQTLLIVSSVGTAIAVLSTAALYFIFRAFGEKGAGGKRHIGLIAGLVAFIFICCFALFALSYR